MNGEHERKGRAREGAATGEVELPDSIRRMAGSYHAPPPTPREAIWEGIDGRLERRGRRGRGGPGGSRRAVAPGLWTGRLAAAIALVAVGFGAGRISLGVVDGRSGGPGDPAGAGTPASVPQAPPSVEGAALDFLTRSETLLATVRSDAREGVVGPGVGAWGRGLLRETRLILDSPAAVDPAMRALLEDLELVLAQVALLSDRAAVGEARGREELRLIARGVDRQELLPRIHAVLPVGTDARTEEGDR